MRSADGDDGDSREVLAARVEASVWISRLHGLERSPEMEEGFRRWLAERGENAREFEGLTEVWELLDASDVPRARRRAEGWEFPRQPRRAWRGWRPLLAAAATVCLVAFAFYLHGARSWLNYAVAVGEQRTVRLDDGSRVSINSGSKVAIRYEATERRVRLVQGEALFEVATDAERPFVVDVGDHRVTALGTSFVVRRQEEQFAVTLIEGKVLVASQGSHDAASAAIPAAVREELLPGQRLTLKANAAPVLDKPRLEMVTGWRRGEVVLEDMRLADAVAEMNRYDANAIVIDDGEVGTLTVSGLYHIGDSLGFARSVALMHDLEVVEREGRIYLKK